MTMTCAKCGEALIAPDLVRIRRVNVWFSIFWSCTCGDRFQTEAYMPADAKPKMTDKDWEQMFPALLVA